MTLLVHRLSILKELAHSRGVKAPSVPPILAKTYESVGPSSLVSLREAEKPPLFGTDALGRWLKDLSRALAAFGGARSAPLTGPSAGAFQQPFQSMAAR
jgi:hypothetical protein